MSFLLDNYDVDKFCSTWLGSGDQSPELVFIGLEFSSEAKSKESILSFFDEIHKLGYPKIIADYNEFVNNHTRRHEPDFDFTYAINGANNPTRKKMSIIAFCILNQLNLDSSINKRDDFKEFILKFASNNSKTTALELFPLPCLNEKNFPYSDWINTKIYPQFIDKKTYREFYENKRIDLFRSYLSNNSIKNIIMYSLGNKKIYESILDIKFSEGKTKDGSRFYFSKENNRNYYLIKHLSSFGFSHDYVNELLNFNHL